MDIKILEDGKEFKYRASGIVKKDDKVLIVDIRNKGYFVFPGGHIEFGKTSMEEVIREIKEEFLIDTKVIKPLCICENFFRRKDDTNVHEVAIYYVLEPVEDIEIEKEKIIEIDEAEDGYINNMKFIWIDILDIPKYDIRPKEVAKDFLDYFKGLDNNKEEIENKYDNTLRHHISKNI